MILVDGFDAVEVEKHINMEDTPFLEKYSTSEHKCYMKPSFYFNPANENFWDMFFTTKKEESASLSKKKDALKILESMTFEQRLFAKYKANTLSKDEMQLNLFPSAELPIYSDYLTTSNTEENQSQPFRNKILAMDCEMVRTQVGLELARITIINFEFETIYDEFVKPEHVVEDHLTKFSGITPEILAKAKKTLKDVQNDFAKICSSETILIGHSLENDLNCMKIVHQNVVDTSVLYYSPKGFKISLKNLANTYLSLDIQKNTHDSSEDAKAALSLAKLKVEIFEHIKTNEQKNTLHLDFLEKLLHSKKTVLPLDESRYLKNVLKYGVHYDEVFSSSLDNITVKIMKWLKMKAYGTKIPSLISGVIRHASETHPQHTHSNNHDAKVESPHKHFFVSLDKKLVEIFKLASKNTG